MNKLFFLFKAYKLFLVTCSGAHMKQNFKKRQSKKNPKPNGSMWKILKSDELKVIHSTPISLHLFIFFFLNEKLSLQRHTSPEQFK